ncbi:hypothetical protein TWF970_010139 [Orbilia oligospora]|uniref:Uncharacterized protein n=1 Tax=Orbilia oligospora TaxID=2813651 RepID=A0A7C8V860_ORBOL|nr:hypothetical protein TWF970_010139 [Orbilia oligospora]
MSSTAAMFEEDPILLCLVIAILLATILVRTYSSRSGPVRDVSPNPSSPPTQLALPASLSKRSPGLQGAGLWNLIDGGNLEWIPMDFKAPDPPPYPDWDVKTTKPLPYRPFKYGPTYFVTMGLRKGNLDDWIELDNEYLKFHAIKKERIESRGDSLCKTAPEALDAAIELLELLCDYLPKRYPSMFTKTGVGVDNIITNESFNITQRPLLEEPMRTIGRLIQDDIAIMVEGSDGLSYLKSGSIILPGFWKLEEKFNMNLSDIHTSGDVPQFREKLERGMVNFFKRVMPDDMVIRHNYFMQVDDGLAWSHSIGPEDSPHVGWFTAEKDKVVENHWFRSERQTLRRLPRSGGVVFTIRTYFHPVTEVAKEPYVPGRLASAIRSWGDDVAKYKGSEKYKSILLNFLDQENEKQIDLGLISEGGESHLKYPY